ncbi:DUF7096 domain-containing protein [Halarchaeum salinum]|uniref:DUF7096 domain-containing protein n=1 Tax=Halarchaeum salinum TaxID=489912 RepID=A0AAV3S9F4_9EURY
MTHQRLTATLASLLLVVGVLSAVPAMGAAASAPADGPNAIGTAPELGQQANNTTDTTGNETVENTTTSDEPVENDTSTNETLAPGERLSGAIGVQAAELEGELETRTFGLKIAQMATPDEKAELVENQTNQSQQRIEELRSELQALEEARANGTISHGEYVSRSAQIHARLNNVQKMSNKTLNVSKSLPEAVLQNNGVNVTAITQLRQHAANLSGPEVAAIARTIGGPGVGQGPPSNVTVGPPSNVTTGPPSNVTVGPPENKTRGPAESAPHNESDGDTADSGPPSDAGPGASPGSNGGPDDSSSASGNGGSSGPGSSSGANGNDDASSGGPSASNAHAGP